MKLLTCGSAFCTQSHPHYQDMNCDAIKAQLIACGVQFPENYKDMSSHAQHEALMAERKARMAEYRKEHSQGK